MELREVKIGDRKEKAEEIMRSVNVVRVRRNMERESKWSIWMGAATLDDGFQQKVGLYFRSFSQLYGHSRSFENTELEVGMSEVGGYTSVFEPSGRIECYFSP